MPLHRGVQWHSMCLSFTLLCLIECNAGMGLSVNSAS